MRPSLTDQSLDLQSSMKMGSHSALTKINSMVLTPHLPLYAGGSMFIELECESQSVQIGNTVSGKVKASIQDSFKAKSLTLSLRGYQRASYKPSMSADKFEQSSDHVRKTKAIIDEKFVIEEFSDGVEQVG